MKNEMPDETAPFLSLPKEKESVAAALIKADDKRKAALSATICFAFAAGFTAFQISLFDIAVIGSYLMAIICASLGWKLSNWMWHSVAVCIVAPEIVTRYGQASIRNAWQLLSFENWISSQFNSRDHKLTSWQSEGNYRDIAYRLSEISVRPATMTKQHFPPRYYLAAEISVPVQFSGRIEIRFRNPVADKFITLMKQMLGNDRRHYTGDQRFDDVFETYIENCLNPQELLTPALRKTLLTIAQYGLRSQFSARFEAGQFHLDSPIESLIFKEASLLTPMPQLMDTTQNLWWDLTIPQRLIDGLTGNYEGPLH